MQGRGLPRVPVPAYMGTTEFQAYSRRKKVKKEETDGRPLVREDQSVDCGRSKFAHRTVDADRANRLLSLEMDVAEALVEFSRMAHLPSQQHKVLRWSCKRRRTASSFSKDLVASPLQPNEDLEDALSAIKKNRSACVLGRDTSTSDKDEIESTRFSKGSSSIFESRAQSPSSPLPSLQLQSGAFETCGGVGAKSAFQRVHPVAPCLVTVKAEIEDLHSEQLPMRHPQVSVRPKLKACKSSMGSKASVKSEPGLDHLARCPEEAALKCTATEAKGAGPDALSKAKCGLSEEEKEARRLRRIQANRESARQTIRKKQVLCEDLTQKASSLALENETMRQKRDSLTQELFQLKEQNHHLKQQLEKRSSGNLGLDAVALRLKDARDETCRTSSQPTSLPYANMPSPALFWAMAASAAAAASQAYAFNNQERWDASSTLQYQNSTASLSSSLPFFQQSSMPGSAEQNLNLACSGDSFLTGMDLPQKGRGSMVNVCQSLPALEAQCDDSSHNTAHSMAEYSSGVLSGNLVCDTLRKPGGTSPHPTVPVRPAMNSSCSNVTATSKSKEFVQGQHMVQGPACGLSYMAGFSKVNLQAQAMKSYAAKVAADARRRRKELIRNKVARARALKSAIVT